MYYLVNSEDGLMDKIRVHHLGTDIGGKYDLEERQGKKYRDETNLLPMKKKQEEKEKLRNSSLLTLKVNT